MKSIVENNAASNKIANSINISVIEEDSDIIEGMFWKEVRENEKFLETTNFTEHELLDIWYDMQPQIEEQRTRGPKPKVSNIDGFLYSLIWYKTGFDFNQLSAFTRIKKTTMMSTIERIHPILLSTLRKRWESKPRPKPLASNYPYIALLVDSTSIEDLRKRKVTLMQNMGYMH